MPETKKSMLVLTVGPISNDNDHKAALARINEIFKATPGTPEGDELEVLLTLVTAYEDKHVSIANPDPIEAIKIRMEDLGWKNKDLIPLLGDKATVSKILNRKRPLTLEMVRKLSEALTLPADVLISEYALAA